MRQPYLALAALAFLLIAPPAFAHAIGGTRRRRSSQRRVGADPFPFLYLGAKHMVTGYDHLLFLARRHLLPLPAEGRPALRHAVLARPFDHAAAGRAVRPRRLVASCRHGHRPVGFLQGVREPRRLPQARLRTRQPRRRRRLRPRPRPRPRHQAAGPRPQPRRPPPQPHRLQHRRRDRPAHRPVADPRRHDVLAHDQEASAASPSPPTHCFSSPASCWPANSLRVTFLLETPDA